MSTGIAVIPKLVVTVEGKVKESNLPAFHEASKKFVSQINRIYKTDEDFGQAELDIKALKGAETLCKNEEENVMAQTHDIREVVKEIRFIGEGFRTPRLEIEREVKEQKDHIRIVEMKEASDEILELENRLSQEINKEFPVRLGFTRPDLYDAIKGLRTIDSVKASIAKEKDAAILMLNLIAVEIKEKLLWFREQGYMEHKMFFGDMPNIIHAEMEGFKAMVVLRVKEHLEEVKKKEEQQREKIRIQEEAKAKIKVEAEAIAKAQAEERAIAAQKIADIPRQTEPTKDLVKDLAKDIPFPAVPRQVTEEENSERIMRIKTARALCDTFMAMSMSLEEASQVRLEMLTFLQKTDWVE